MLHSTTVPATAQTAWPLWWKTSGMSAMVNAGETKLLAFAIPGNIDQDSVAHKLSVGDGVQYGGERLDITEVYKPGYSFTKAGFPQGSVKPGVLIVAYKASTADPYTLQAVAVANVVGLRLQDAMDVKDAILPAPDATVKSDSDKPVTVVTPVGEGIPDTINQLTQFAVVGGLVVLGIMAFKKFAR